MFKRLVARALSSHGERQATLLFEQQRAWRRLLNVPNVLRAMLETRVGTTPADVVLRYGTLSLLRYRRQTPATRAEPVVFCYALVNRPYILDLQPGKSVVEHYLAQGFEVYMVDWGSPSLDDRGLTLEDYVRERLARVVEHVLHAHGSPALHLLGYCMGGTLAALFTALEPRRVKTLTLLAAPIDFSPRGSLINLWVSRKYFDVDRFIDVHGNCPGWFLQLCFLYTKPIQNLLEKYVAFYEQMEDPRFLSNYFAMDRWTNDNIPIAGEAFREFVKKLYQGNELVRGQLRLGERRVRLEHIECPLLLLTARNDHLVVPASTAGIKGHVASQDIKDMTIDAGHVGLVVSAKAHKSFWPEAARWLAERSEEVPHGYSN
jgi:polyhydroxyalkanoate synthase